jgi:hypothetical protein
MTEWWMQVKGGKKVKATFGAASLNGGGKGVQGPARYFLSRKPHPSPFLSLENYHAFAFSN